MLLALDQVDPITVYLVQFVIKIIHTMAGLYEQRLVVKYIFTENVLEILKVIGLYNKKKLPAFLI